MSNEREWGDHPPADLLVDHAEGRCPQAVAERLRRHLGECVDCRRLVADLAAYPRIEPPGEGHRVDREELRSTLARLLPETPAPDAEEPAAGSGSGDRDPPARWHLAWAAVLLLALGWGAQQWLANQELRRQAQAARSNVPIVGLFPADDPWRSPEGSVLSLAAGLTVALAEDQPFPAGAYAARVLDAGGEVRLEVADLRPDAGGNLTFHLPAGSLPAGNYRLVLVDQDGVDWPRHFELTVAP